MVDAALSKTPVPTSPTTDGAVGDARWDLAGHGSGFLLDKDVDVAAQEVRDKVNGVLPLLPG